MLKIGRYRHFKGGEYELLHSATHSETGEQMVVYRALYGEKGVWVRPAKMWSETVELGGQNVPRFAYIGEVVLESERLYLRKMTHDDFEDVAEMLRDEIVMAAWEKTFSDAEITAWIDRRLRGYAQNGYSHFLAIDKQTLTCVGQIGILEEELDGKQFLGIGWLLKRSQWGKGYAAEGGKACLDYAFNVLKGAKVVADIRPTNTRSIAVAKRLNMTPTGEFIKVVDGKDMPHILFEIEK